MASQQQPAAAEAAAAQQSEPLRLTPHDTSPEQPQQQQNKPPFSSARDLLEYLYEDVTRLSQIASENCVLHPADNSLPPCLGVAACQAHEEELLKTTRGTLKMRVESITLSSSHEFGCVMGKFELGGGEVRETFCGVWRFEMGATDGEEVRAVEHWENLTPEARRRVADLRPQLPPQPLPLPPLRLEQSLPLPHLPLKHPTQLKLDKLATIRQLSHLPLRYLTQVHMPRPPAPSHLHRRHPQDISDIPRMPLPRGRELGAEPAIQSSKLRDVPPVERDKCSGLIGRQGICKRRRRKGRVEDTGGATGVG
ncbi:Putative protein of unknown function [Podospora comata]|uniref:SnoaL-like domain-containing protein n=1 Tax=Podospora comata TaxID=48703 RepID=A0ABY6RY12_PODCO|nr:Putative protein of unknown function [Podospora comata]